MHKTSGPGNFCNMTVLAECLPKKNSRAVYPRMSCQRCSRKYVLFKMHNDIQAKASSHHFHILINSWSKMASVQENRHASAGRSSRKLEPFWKKGVAALWHGSLLQLLNSTLGEDESMHRKARFLDMSDLAYFCSFLGPSSKMTMPLCLSYLLFRCFLGQLKYEFFGFKDFHEP